MLNPNRRTLFANTSRPSLSSNQSVPKHLSVPDEVVCDVVRCIKDADIDGLQSFLLGRYPLAAVCWHIESTGGLQLQHVLGRTLLSLAASCSTVEVVEFLVLAGAKVDAKDSHTGYTPLIVAVLRHEHTIVDLLLRYSASPNLTVSIGKKQFLIEINSLKDSPVLELFLLHRTDQRSLENEDARIVVTTLDLALMTRAKVFRKEHHYNANEIVKCLLRAGVEPLASVYLIIMPLLSRGYIDPHYEQDEGNLLLEFIRAGLDLQAMIFLPSYCGHNRACTLEHAFLFHTHGFYFMKFLARNLDIQPQEGRTNLLHTLCGGVHTKGHTCRGFDSEMERQVSEAISILLKRGIDPNVYDGGGSTPLERLVRAIIFNSAGRDALVCIRLLLKAGADPFQLTRLGSPIEAALTRTS